MQSLPQKPVHSTQDKLNWNFRTPTCWRQPAYESTTCECVIIEDAQKLQDQSCNPLAKSTRMQS
eukprot:4866801-Amphidinium_carterae.1